MGLVRVKSDVRFDRIDPAGFRILGSLDRIARTWPQDVTITCGTERHPTTDPHALGRAYDVRTHGLTDEHKQYLLRAVLFDLQDDPGAALLDVSGGFATAKFFGWLEHPGEENEHLHFQQRRNTTFASEESAIL